MTENQRNIRLFSIFPKELINLVKGTPIELALNKNIDLETRIEFLLPYLGLPTNLKGYEYIKYAILLVSDDESKIKRMTSGLYPEIGAHFNSTASRVERSMRHAIEICFNRMDKSINKWLFGYSIDPIKGKCTNTEFISRITRLLTKM